MKTKTDTNTHTKSDENIPAKKYRQIKLGVDVHADSYRVVRQIDGATPQPAQKFTPAGFLVFASRQLAEAEEVHSCYEAGPFGYVLHRQLIDLGIRNVVIRPQNWDEHGRKVKTDKTDALALVQRLAQYVAGNQKALAVVRVPTQEEEQQRALARQRDQFSKDRQSHEAQGRSLLLYYGYRVKGQWWQERAWNRLELPVWLKELLARTRAQVLQADQLLQEVDRLLGEQAQSREQPLPVPKGFGVHTLEHARCEVQDWGRFKNRRQVASLTGLCPGVQASGRKSISGPINKHGNPKLRWLLIQLAWRVVRYQPDYPPVQHWKEVLLDKKSPGRRKKAIVAIARKLAIDLWRLATGRCTAEELKLR